jgi:hypothetical protein
MVLEVNQISGLGSFQIVSQNQYRPLLVASTVVLSPQPSSWFPARSCRES